MDVNSVKSHNTTDDCWIIIDGKVYDVTKYLDDHPGGSEIIMNLAGADATREFNDIGHSKSAIQILDKYEIGICPDYKKADDVHEKSSVSWFHRMLVWLWPNYYTDEKKPVALASKEQLTHDTIRLTFAIPGNMKLWRNCAQHIVCYNGDHNRKYTPTSTKAGEFELVVKVYPEGKLSSFMDKMNVGDTLLISGPAGRHLYNGNGNFSTANQRIFTNNILFICAGSGITPIYSIMQDMADEDINTKLLFVNRTEGDIILRKELDEMSSRNGNMRNYYALTQPGENWAGLVGRPSKEMISEIASLNEVVIVCGSSDFNEAMSTICIELGYTKDKLILF